MRCQCYIVEVLLLFFILSSEALIPRSTRTTARLADGRPPLEFPTPSDALHVPLTPITTSPTGRKTLPAPPSPTRAPTTLRGQAPPTRAPSRAPTTLRPSQRPTTRTPTLHPTRDPCLPETCSVNWNSSNVCINLGNGAWRCECANGWGLGTYSRSCMPPRFCGNDECSQREGNRNTCHDNYNGTYYCTCDTAGWSYPGSRDDRIYYNDGYDTSDVPDIPYYWPDSAPLYPDGIDVALKTYCVPPRVRCENDECNQTKSSDNSCRDLNNGNWTCTCARGWVRSPDRRQCNLPPQCRANECNSTQQSGNLCTDNGDGTYSCTCQYPWQLGSAPSRATTIGNPQACIPITRCQSGECSTQRGPANKCIDLHNGNYQCVCAKGWVAAPDAQSCFERAPLCVSNECKTTLDKRNVCTDNRDGTYSCSCAPNWGLVVNVTCVAPVLCQKNECSQNTVGNLCTDQGDGTYFCTCNSPGYSAGASLLSCTAPVKACLVDHCSKGQNPKNQCIDAPDGTYTCVCGAGWSLRVDQRACLSPLVCTNNECHQQDASVNTCTDNGDQTYTCHCGLGWTLAPNKSTCVGVATVCVNDECSSSVSTTNMCVDNHDGTYYCMCGSPWGTPKPPLSCTAPLVCTSDECSTSENAINVCTPNPQQPATYRCTCGAPYVVAPDGLSCIAPLTGCLLNFCQQQYPENQCITAADGTYSCECGTGWISTNENLRCQRDPCIGQCSVADDANNKCVPTSTGAYQCQCAQGWTSGADGRNCTKPCDGNPCGIPVAASRCTVTLSSRLCTCTAGYVLSPDGTACVGCSQEQRTACAVAAGNLCAISGGSPKCTCITAPYKTSADGNKCVLPTTRAPSRAPSRTPSTSMPTRSPVRGSPVRTPTLRPSATASPLKAGPRPTLPRPITARPTGLFVSLGSGEGLTLGGPRTLKPTQKPTVGIPRTVKPTIAARPRTATPTPPPLTPALQLLPAASLATRTVVFEGFATGTIAELPLLDLDTYLSYMCAGQYPGSAAVYQVQLTSGKILDLPQNNPNPLILKCQPGAFDCLAFTPSAARLCVPPMQLHAPALSTVLIACVQNNNTPVTTICATDQSCQGRCGVFIQGQCTCDDQCASRGTCCDDYAQVCPLESCSGRCGQRSTANACKCDSSCTTSGTSGCCADFTRVCSVTATSSL